MERATERERETECAITPADIVWTGTVDFRKIGRICLTL